MPTNLIGIKFKLDHFIKTINSYDIHNLSIKIKKTATILMKIRNLFL